MAKTDIGPPDYKELIPEVVKNNYGTWKYHEQLKPGVLMHVGESGDKLYTVRCASPKVVSIDFIRDLCDIADQYCDGHMRFTSRYNPEFLTTKQENIEPIISALDKLGLPIGGTGKCISNMVHTQGWIHCHSAATDASGLVKSIMDVMFPYFTGEKTLPNKLRLSLACCINMCGAIHATDLAVVGVHTKVPVPDDAKLGQLCEVPTTLASCPTGAIRRHPDKDVKSVTVNADKCMYCGNCYTVCPSMPIADAEGDGVAIYVGGKVADARSAPKFSRLAIPYITNNPPRWPEVTGALLKIVETYAANGRKYERMGEWIDRVGYERFFELTGLPFSEYHVDDFKYARTTYRTSTQFKW